MAHLRILAVAACAATVFTALPALAKPSADSFEAVAAREFSSPELDRELSQLASEDRGHGFGHSYDHDDHGIGRGFDDDHGHISPVPEPGTWALMLAGGAGMVALARRRRQD